MDDGKGCAVRLSVSIAVPEPDRADPYRSAVTARIVRAVF